MKNYKIYVDISELQAVNIHFMLDKTFLVLKQTKTNIQTFRTDFGEDDEFGILKYMVDFEKDFSKRMEGAVRLPTTIFACYAAKRDEKVSDENKQKINFLAVIQNEIRRRIPQKQTKITKSLTPSPSSHQPAKKARCQIDSDSEDETTDLTETAIVLTDFTDFEKDAIVGEQMENFEKISFSAQDSKHGICQKWKELVNGVGPKQFPQIVQAARDSFVVAASNRDAETTFSFTTIASNYLGSTKKVGTLIGEVFVKMTEGSVNDDSPVPDIKNYDTYDDDFNSVNEVDVNQTISDDEWFDDASDSD